MDINNIDRDRYNTLMVRYDKFKEHLSEPNKEAIRVFDPLSKKQLEELLLIREVSKELQKKLNEDLKKASAQAAAEVKTEKEKSDEKSDEKSTE